MIEFSITDTFTDCLAKLAGKEQKAVKTTATTGLHCSAGGLGAEAAGQPDTISMGYSRSTAGAAGVHGELILKRHLAVEMDLHNAFVSRNCVPERVA